MRDGQAAPAGVTSRARDATPCHRAGCSHLMSYPQPGQRCPQHKPALHLLPGGQCHAIAPDVVTYSAASSMCRSASSTSEPCISYVRCSGMPSSRTWSPTVLPLGPAAPAGVASRLYFYMPPIRFGRPVTRSWLSPAFRPGTLPGSGCTWMVAMSLARGFLILLALQPCLGLWRPRRPSTI